MNGRNEAEAVGRSITPSLSSSTSSPSLSSTLSSSKKPTKLKAYSVPHSVLNTFQVTNKIENLLCATHRSKHFPSYKSSRTDCVRCYTPYKTASSLTCKKDEKPLKN